MIYIQFFQIYDAAFNIPLISKYKYIKQLLRARLYTIVPLSINNFTSRGQQHNHLHPPTSCVQTAIAGALLRCGEYLGFNNHRSTLLFTNTN